MPLDPHAKRLLDMLATAGTCVSERTPRGMREDFHRLTRIVGANNISIASIENGLLPGLSGPLPFRRYLPEAPSGKLQPACVYIHGGGGVFGSIETHDGLCRIIANESKCQVISLEYRLAPEHKFPAAFLDCLSATEWITKTALQLSIDENRIAIAGDSAGGGLAAAICQMTHQTGRAKLALQVLICPVLDISRQTKSRRAFTTGYGLDKATLDWMAAQLCPAGMDLKDPKLSPIYGQLFPDLPPVQIHTAEYDPLQSEGKIYARLLKRAGISVHYTCHRGMPHNFYGMTGAIPSAFEHTKQIAIALRQGLENTSTTCTNA